MHPYTPPVPCNEALLHYSSFILQYYSFYCASGNLRIIIRSFVSRLVILRSVQLS